LRFVPDEKYVVLGLLTTKTGALESRDEILNRIDEASQYHPIERLALSPQCGFASNSAGNHLQPEEQWAKLARVVEIAREVWQ
jgi:5-methyltetrahydropteroyltriglutamate--homocysteine methyltransferase